MLSLSLIVRGGRTSFKSILSLEVGVYLVRHGPEGIGRGLLRFEREEEGGHRREGKGEGGGLRSLETRARFLLQLLSFASRMLSFFFLIQE